MELATYYLFNYHVELEAAIPKVSEIEIDGTVKYYHVGEIGFVDASP